MLDLGTMGTLEWAADNEQEHANQPVVEGYFNVYSASCANLAPKDLSKCRIYYNIDGINNESRRLERPVHHLHGE